MIIDIKKESYDVWFLFLCVLLSPIPVIEAEKWFPADFGGIMEKKSEVVFKFLPCECSGAGGMLDAWIVLSEITT